MRLYPNDPQALGRWWVGPYVELEPSLAYVLRGRDGNVCGYMLGALCTRTLYKRAAETYFPRVAAHHDPEELGLTSDEATARRLRAWGGDPSRPPARRGCGPRVGPRRAPK